MFPIMRSRLETLQKACETSKSQGFWPCYCLKKCATIAGSAAGPKDDSRDSEDEAPLVPPKSQWQLLDKLSPEGMQENEHLQLLGCVQGYALRGRCSLPAGTFVHCVVDNLGEDCFTLNTKGKGAVPFKVALNDYVVINGQLACRCVLRSQ